MRLHLAAPDVDGEHRLHQVPGGPGLGQRRDLLPDLVALLEELLGVVIREETLVAEDADELGIGAHGDGHPAVGGRIDAERRLHAGMADAGIGALEIDAEVHRHQHLLPLVGEHAGQQVDLDLLPLARPLAPVEGGEDAVDHVHRPDLVGEARPHRHRRSVAAAGGGGDAGQSLDQHVLARTAEVRPAVAVARARAVDDPRIDLPERFVAVSHPRHHAGAEVLDDDVGLRRDPVEDFLRLRALQVDGERALVAVPGEEIRALRAADPAVVEGHGAEQVALPRPLDLDDVRPHVGKELRRERPLQEVAEIEDGDVGEGFFGHGRTRTAFALFRQDRLGTPPSASTAACRWCRCRCA